MGRRRAFAHKRGVSSATFYKRKAKYGGLDVSDARRLNALEDENVKLKKLLAEAMLDNAMLKEINSCMTRPVIPGEAGLWRSDTHRMRKTLADHRALSINRFFSSEALEQPV